MALRISWFLSQLIFKVSVTLEHWGLESEWVDLTYFQTAIK